MMKKTQKSKLRFILTPLLFLGYLTVIGIGATFWFFGFGLVWLGELMMKKAKRRQEKLGL